VGLAHEGAIVLGVAAEPADFLAQLFDDLLALVCALAENLAEALDLDVLGRIFVERDAVDGRVDQRVEGADLVRMFMIGHALTPFL
jgi:hypothetical protein